jgi:hypothetical protein
VAISYATGQVLVTQRGPGWQDNFPHRLGHEGLYWRGPRFDRGGDFPRPCIIEAPRGRFRTVSTRARRVNVNLELSRSGNGVRNGFRRPDERGSGQFAESALDTLYVARNRG